MVGRTGDASPCPRSGYAHDRDRDLELCDATPVDVQDSVDDVALCLPLVDARVHVPLTLHGPVQQQPARDRHVAAVYLFIYLFIMCIKHHDRRVM